MMNAIASHILALPAWVAILVVFAMPALESSAFVGFVFPGEIALVLGGVLASQGQVPLAAVLAAGITGSAVGDSVGYAVGRRYGRRLLEGTIGRFVNHEHFDRAERYLAERGGKAVFLGRFTAALRVLVPGLAGMSGMRYRTFLTYNVSSAVAWGTMSVLIGYLGGSSWRHVEHIASRVGLGALAVVVLAAVVAYLLRRGHGARLRGVLAGLGRSTPVGRVRARFPRTSSWAIGRFDPTVRRGLGLTAAVSVAVASTWTFLGITQDVVTGEELARVDPGTHSWVLAHRTPVLNTFFEVATWLGASWVTIPVLALVGGLLARRRHSWAPVRAVTLVYGVALLLRALIGQLVHRSRPPATDWLTSASGWGYPSGHTTQAVAAWGAMVLLVGMRSTPRARLLLTCAAACIVILVAASRVYLGVHWFTDVLGAAALSTAILSAWVAGHRLLVVPPSPTP